MNIRLHWSEEVAYRSVIEIDEVDLLKWANEGNPPTDPPVTLQDISPEQIKEYLDSGDEAAWFEQCDTGTDFVTVNERTIDSAWLNES